MIYLKKFQFFSKFLPSKQKYDHIVLKLCSFLIIEGFAFSTLKTYKIVSKKFAPGIAEELVYSSTDF